MIIYFVDLMNDVLIKDLTPGQIASICDHTFLRRAEEYRGPDVNAVEEREKDFYNFLEDTVNGLTPYAICVRPEDVHFAKRYLSDNKSDIKIASVVGFPDGNWYQSRQKVDEMSIAIDSGADEIDMVMRYSALKEGDYQGVCNDIHAVKNSLDKYSINKDIVLKLILETSELSPEEIKTACEIARDYGVDFVKTSTGFTSQGATSVDVAIMRDNFSGGIKISGGVNPGNIYSLLRAASGRDDGYIDLDPMKVRIGESSLLSGF